MLSNKKGLTYADAGVDIDAGNKAVELMKDSVKATYRPEVLGDLGGFGGLAGSSGTGRSGSFGSSLPVFGDDQRRRYADADGQRQCAEGQALCHPFAAHALCSRLAR